MPKGSGSKTLYFNTPKDNEFEIEVFYTWYDYPARYDKDGSGGDPPESGIEITDTEPVAPDWLTDEMILEELENKL